jgi:hypothetical protein
MPVLCEFALPGMDAIVDIETNPAELSGGVAPAWA